MAENKNLFEQARWNTTYSNRTFEPATDSDPIVTLLRHHLPGGPGNAIEIGCCPGSYLVHLGYLGYTISGIDLSPSVHDTKQAMMDCGVACGDFFEIDFFEFCKDRSRRYDAVVSFGFVEHFTKFEKVFFHHAELVADGGYLIVTFPNFLGHLQFALHSLLDADGMQRHNTEAMNVARYQKIAEAMDFEVLFSGYFGGFNFWSSTPLEKRNSKELLSLDLGIATLNACKAVAGDNPAWSQYGGIVAKKRAHV